MKIYNNTIGFLASLCFCANVAIAGQTTITTSDSAPSYNNCTEVIVPVGVTVKIDTTCDNGTVQVTYSQSDGVTMQDGYPQQVGEKEMIAVFDLDSSTAGNVNTVSIHITHNGSDGTPCVSDGDDQTFTICVPQVSAAMEGEEGNPDNTNAVGPMTNSGPSATIVNMYSNYNFWNRIYVKGIDDPTQLDFTQLLRNSTTDYDYYGNDSSPPSGPTVNTGGFVPDTSIADWHQIGDHAGLLWIREGRTSTYFSDSHGVADIHRTVTISGTVYYYSFLQYTTNDFECKVRRHADGVNLHEYDWGYTWDNNNARWNSATTPPLSSFTAATRGGTGGVRTRGYISAAFGGDAQQTTGEFTGLYGRGIHLPSNHNP